MASGNSRDILARNEDVLARPAKGGRPKGQPLPQEHRARITASMRGRSMDRHFDQVTELREKLDSGDLALDRILAAMAEQLQDDEMLTSVQRNLVNALHSLSRGDLMSVNDAMQQPYVGQDQAMHRPMTGSHSHGHAAFGHPDHDDGLHHHSHSHVNDADHDHGHGGLDMRADEGPGGDSRDGIYGRLMNTTSPAERARLRRQLNEAHEQTAR